MQVVVWVIVAAEARRLRDATLRGIEVRMLREGARVCADGWRGLWVFAMRL